MNLLLLSAISIIFIIIAIIYIIIKTEIYNKTPLQSLKDRRISIRTQTINVALVISIIGVLISLPLTVVSFFSPSSARQGSSAPMPSTGVATISLSWMLYIISLVLLLVSIAAWLRYNLPYIKSVDTLLKAAIVASLVNFIIISLSFPLKRKIRGFSLIECNL